MEVASIIIFELIACYKGLPPTIFNGGLTQNYTSKNYNYYTFKNQSKFVLYQEGIYEIIWWKLLFLSNWNIWIQRLYIFHVWYLNGFLVVYSLFLPLAMECKNNSYIPFKKYIFELKYNVANDTKESEIGIKFVLTINKKYFCELFLHLHCRKYYFTEKGIIQWNKKYSVEYFCPQPQKIFIFYVF